MKRFLRWWWGWGGVIAINLIIIGHGLHWLPDTDTFLYGWLFLYLGLPLLLWLTGNLPKDLQ